MMFIAVLFICSGLATANVENANDNWRTKATLSISFLMRSTERAGPFEFSEKHRRKLAAWQTLPSCPLFQTGSNFNVINVPSCSLTQTTTLDGQKTLRIRGQTKPGQGPPVLSRGIATTQHPTYTADRHFILTGESVLTLMHLKLSGAFVGRTDSGCKKCGYCQITVQGGCCDCPGCAGCDPCSGSGCGSRCLTGSGGSYLCTGSAWCNPDVTCNDTPTTTSKGGAILVKSASSKIFLIDVVFESNTADESTGNIFATQNFALYIFEMAKIPELIVGVTSIFFVTQCGDDANAVCSNLDSNFICAADSTSPSCVCARGHWGKPMLGPCKSCEVGRYSNSTGGSDEATCKPCAAGFYSTIAAATACESCL